MPSFPPPPAWAARLSTAGVTGTNGKTTTVTWLAAALGATSGPVAGVTTVGSWVGTDSFGVADDYERFLEVMRACHQRGGRLAAIELTSAALASGFARAWPCDVGVFTNLSLDHLEMHGSAEHYLASKAQLFMALPSAGTAVLNARDPACRLIDEVTPAAVRRLRYGVPSRGPSVLDADLEARVVGTTLEGTTLELSNAGRALGLPSTLRLRAVGDIHAENALAALLGAVAMGADGGAAARLIESTSPPAGRFEVVHRQPTVVVDYAHSPDALRRALATARSLCGGELHLVFGAGGGLTRSKRAPLGQAAALADRVTLTSDNPRDEDPAVIAAQVRAGLAGHACVEVELDRRRGIENALDGAAPTDMVLIAGKGHETVQVVGASKQRFSDADVVRAFYAARCR